MTDEVLHVSDLEEFARKSLPKTVFEYYRSGAYPEHTLRDNERAFQRYILRPKLLQDVSNRDSRTTILGRDISFPVAIAPTALHRMAHDEGELATAKAARSMGTGMVLSTYTSTPMEDVAEAMSPAGLLWAQMSVYNDETIVRQMVKKAEDYGFQAIFLTVDSKSVRRKSTKNLMPPHVRFANFDAARCQDFATMEAMANDKLTWEHIDWLRSITSLPIALKGILTGEGALEARKHNIAGLVVSNHGGRALDGFPATIDALAEVVEAVRGSGIEVYLDGGVRTGSDVFKALAMGAQAVFIGRPVLWGLAYNGQDGVRRVLEILKNEFDRTMALTGCSKVTDITPSLVVREQYYTSKL